MISVEELFKEGKYPKWIASNPIFSKIGYIRKVFPTIGLSNFEEKQVIDNSTEIATFANQLLDLIADSLKDRTKKLEDFSKKGKIGKKRREELTLLISVMNSLNAQLRKDKKLFITPQDSGKVTLSIPEDLYHGETLFMKKGAGLLKIYEKINGLLKANKFLVLDDLTKKHQFKNFSAINIPSKETIIKFSSDGAEGAWDISTMSMRGIASCQTWDQGAGINSLKLVGSMIDPFTGIIYITTDNAKFNNYGSKMVRRCIVRYVIDRISKEPFLLLERMYPAFDQPSLDTFTKTLQKKVGNIPIKYSGHMGERATTLGSQLANSYIPLSDELKMLEGKYYPYCDSHIAFQEDANCKFAKNTNALHTLFKKKIPSLVEKAILSHAFTKENVKKYGTSATGIMSKLRAKKTADKTDAKQICKCKKTGCNRTHYSGAAAKAAAVATKTTTANVSVADLSSRFAEFVCNKTENEDPFHYLAEQESKCTEFFVNEFGASATKEFAEYVASNVFDYIDEKSK